ncbi:hypothetical protein U0C82_01160 [Fulvimarina sp. 2208YS6-2-32]|uniref:Integrase n=1 Tax=Fulvimarina uroteuthidis TaxID=3098149 RepID=A0ABU5HYT2_9HYPH|nr:hypothetical protein [Fulvimarina sp. 2208YS6-2-32]MDY8107754.1 hypothetical protein [Fulvimarina sp. 2208YS6-2-32]
MATPYPPYVQEKKGRFYVRLVVPIELRPFAENSKSEIRFSLGHSLREVKANYARALATAQDELDSIKRAKADAENREHVATARRYTARSHDEIARIHYADELAEDNAARLYPDRSIMMDMSWSRPARLDALRRVSSGNAANDEMAALVGWAIDEYQRRGNHALPFGSAEWRALAMQIARADIEVLARQEERDRGDFLGQPLLPALTVEDVEETPPGRLTFEEIIDAEMKRRTAGKNAKGVVPRTIEKFRRECRLFAEHRKSDNAVTVTKAEAVAWIEHVQTNGTWSNSTLAKALMNIKTVLGWGRKHHSDVMPEIDPLARVEPPQWEEVPSYMRTYTVEEARTILRASLTESRSYRRWVPWLCAYSGARISEIASLRPEDFFEVDGNWFYVLTTTGGRRKKTVSSIRRVPLHPTIVEQGFVDFVTGSQAGKPIFPNGVQQRMGEWIRDDVGIRREHLAPSHGWRHLFEDLCTVAGVSDDARAYITGRATGTSRDRYGRSDAALPGLAREMAKIEPLIKS